MRKPTDLHEQRDQTWAGKIIGPSLRAKNLLDREQVWTAQARRVVGPIRLYHILTKYHELLDRVALRIPSHRQIGWVECYKLKADFVDCLNAN